MILSRYLCDFCHYLILRDVINLNIPVVAFLAFSITFPRYLYFMLSLSGSEKVCLSWFYTQFLSLAARFFLVFRFRLFYITLT